MNLKVNACNPSFGIVSPRAVEMAKSSGEKDVDKLVESQKDNGYFIDKGTFYEDIPCYDVYHYWVIGWPIEKFKSLKAACAYATACNKAAKENGTLYEKMRSRKIFDLSSNDKK